MMLLKTLLVIVLGLLVPLIGAQTNLDDIVDTAIANGNFKILVKALQAAGLENTLQSSGPFTVLVPPTDLTNIFFTISSNGNFRLVAECLLVAGLALPLETEGPFTLFAPTDVAFAKLTPQIVEYLLAPQNRGFLVRILSYHVIPGNLTAAAIKALNPPVEIKTTIDQFVSVTENGNELQVNGASVIITDLFATNGIIHGIDTLLIPPAEDISDTRKLKWTARDGLKSRLISGRTHR
jgi:uncharacterized surface protein with fasciclin (FAS1) repeats